MIAPPYFRLDEHELLAHFVAAARACAPLPFYAYELERASGYAIPPVVVERLRDAVDNLAGMKVSDAPFSKVQPYMLEGLDVFIGAESLICEGLAAGAVGAVSGLAAAFPEVVVEAVRTGDSDAGGRAAAGDRALPAPRRIEGGSRSRAACRCARTCARRCAASRTPSASSCSPRFSRARARRARRSPDGREPARPRGARRRRPARGPAARPRAPSRPRASPADRRPATAKRRAALRRRRSAPSPRPPARSASRRFIAAMLHCRRFSPRPSRRHPKRRTRRRGRFSP